MANIARWRWGDSDPRVVSCLQSTAIEIGDLLYLEGQDGALKDARPASKIPDQGTLIFNQRYFADRFVGVSSQQHRVNQDPEDVTDLRVGTGGIWEFPCPSRVYELGDLMGGDEDAAGTGLLDQGLEFVNKDRPDLAVAVIARREAVANTTCLVEIMPRAVSEGTIPDSTSGSSSSDPG